MHQFSIYRRLQTSCPCVGPWRVHTYPDHIYIINKTTYRCPDTVDIVTNDATQRLTSVFGIWGNLAVHIRICSLAQHDSSKVPSRILRVRNCLILMYDFTPTLCNDRSVAAYFSIHTQAAHIICLTGCSTSESAYRTCSMFDFLQCRACDTRETYHQT